MAYNTKASDIEIAISIHDLPDFEEVKFGSSEQLVKIRTIAEECKSESRSLLQLASNAAKYVRENTPITSRYLKYAVLLDKDSPLKLHGFWIAEGTLYGKWH